MSSKLDKFSQDGFVALPQVVSGAEFAELLAQIQRFIAEVLPGLPPEHVFYEDKEDPATLKQIQQMGQHDAWFHELFTAGCFRRIAEELLEGPVVPKNMQYFNKPPEIGRATPSHQDGYYFMLDPCEAVTMWFALDPADESNGCVHYVRSSHRDGMRPHGRTETLGFSQGIVDYPLESDRERELAMVAQPGDLMVHHALTIHRAGANPSPRHRRALGFIYYSEHAREDVAAHQAYQEKLAREMRDAGKLV
jgi:phytanoyl-CoA hydroxylase